MRNSGLKYKSFKTAFIVGAIILIVRFLIIIAIIARSVRRSNLIIINNLGDCFALPAMTCLLGIALPGSVTETNAAQIVDIRTGYHYNFSRIVVQFDVPTEFYFTKDFQNKRVILEFNQVEVRFRLGGLKVDSDDKFLKRIEYEHAKTKMKLLIYLKSLDVRLDYYSMSYPYRVVIDVYRARRLITPVRKTQPELSENFEKDSVQNLQSAASESSATDTSSVSIINQYQEGDTTDQAKINSILAGILPKESDETNTNPTGNQNNSSQLSQEIKDLANFSNKNVKHNKLILLFGIIGAFIVLDIMIFGYYALRRKRKIKKPESGQKTPSSKAAETTQKDFKTALNDTIQEKISDANSDLIKASHSNVIQDALVSSKIESLIESLSESMSSPDSILQEFPDLEKIAKDLKKISPNENMSTELLIGKDGAEFIKNLDRHS